MAAGAILGVYCGSRMIANEISLYQSGYSFWHSIHPTTCLRRLHQQDIGQCRMKLGCVALQASRGLYCNLMFSSRWTPKIVRQALAPLSKDTTFFENPPPPAPRVWSIEISIEIKLAKLCFDL